MSYIISDDCINCGTCEIECPQNAVYPGIKNQAAGKPEFINNILLFNAFILPEHFYIDPYRCNNCEGFYLSARCNSVCPVSCCLSEDDYFSGRNDTAAIKAHPLLTAKISLN